MLIMCGSSPSGTMSDPSLWFQQINKCNILGQYKLVVIQKHLMDNTVYAGSKVPLSAPNIKMVLKRNWLGKDGYVCVDPLCYVQRTDYFPFSVWIWMLTWRLK